MHAEARSALLRGRVDLAVAVHAAAARAIALALGTRSHRTAVGDGLQTAVAAVDATVEEGLARVLETMRAVDALLAIQPVHVPGERAVQTRAANNAPLVIVFLRERKLVEKTR